MQDYSSLTRRCSSTSLNIFAKDTLSDIGFSYMEIFKKTNIFSFNDELNGNRFIEFITSRIKMYDDSEYAFYQFSTLNPLPRDLVYYMIRWIPIYDAVFLLSEKNETILDFGLLSRKLLDKSSGVGLWRDAFVKYIMPFEGKWKFGKRRIRYLSRQI